MKEKIANALCWLGIFLLAVAMGMFVGFIQRGHARNLNHEWDNSPNRAWYAEQRLTEAAKTRLGFVSCCSDGDEFPTQFKVVEDGTKYGQNRYFYYKDGQWLIVPEDIIKVGETPDGAPHIWLFPYDNRADVPKGTPVCFVIPDNKG